MADVHSKNFLVLTFRLSICSQWYVLNLPPGGNSAADIHSENSCLSKCSPGHFIIILTSAMDIHSKISLVSSSLATYHLLNFSSKRNSLLSCQQRHSTSEAHIFAEISAKYKCTNAVVKNLNEAKKEDVENTNREEDTVRW